MTELDHSTFKVVLFVGSPLAGPVINMLLQQQRLAGIVLAQQVDMFSHQLETWLQQSQLPYTRFNPAQLDTLSAQLRDWQTDLAITFSFPHTLPDNCQQATGYGLYHFHPAPFPQYQGPMPLYWQIRDDRRETQLVLQKSHVRAGQPDIAMSQSLSIHPLDTLQCLEGKVAQQGAVFIDQFIGTLTKNQGQISLQEQAGQVSQAPAVQEADLKVNWQTMSAQQIAALARAGNSQFGGCVVNIGQIDVNLIQATPVSHPTYGVKPGTLCFIGEPQGVVVATHDGALRLDILSSADGVFNGLNFCERFGINAGMEFVSAPQVF